MQNVPFGIMIMDGQEVFMIGHYSKALKRVDISLTYAGSIYNIHMSPQSMHNPYRQIWNGQKKHKEMQRLDEEASRYIRGKNM